MAMAMKNKIKSLEQTLWEAADKLRKNIDAGEYKHIVLGLLFLKYISGSTAWTNLKKCSQAPDIGKKIVALMQRIEKQNIHFYSIFPEDYFSLHLNHCNFGPNAVIPHDDYQRYYLYCYLKVMRPQLEELSTGGSILLNLNTAGFSRLPIPGPPQSQLKIFYRFVHSIFKRIHLNACYINHLIKAGNFLQKRIFMEFFENDSIDW